MLALQPLTKTSSTQASETQDASLDWHAANSVYASVTAAMLLVAFCSSRLGFSLEICAKGLLFWGLTNILLFLPSTIRLMRSGKSPASPNDFLTEPLLLAWTIGATVLLGLLCPAELTRPAIPLIGFSLLVFWLFRLCTANLALSARCLLLAGPLSLGLWISSFLFANTYHNSLLLEKVAFATRTTGVSGVVDTFYHCAMANMLIARGVVSTGLDGTPFNPYHFGSHLVFAQWSKLLGMDALPFYLVGFAVVVVPLFVKSLLTFAQELSNKLAGASCVVFSPVSNVVLLVGCSSFFSPSLSEQLGLWNCLFVSQSYCMGLILLIDLAAIMVNCGRFLQPRAKFHSEALLTLLTVAALVSLCIITKVSLGLLTLAIMSYLFVRKQLYKVPRATVYFALVCLAGGIAYRAVATYLANIDSTLCVEPLAFYKQFLRPDYVFYHLLLFYSWTAIFAIAKLARERSAPHPLWSRLCAGEFLEVESIVLFAFIGTLPCLLIKSNGGNQIYFSDPQYWLGLSGVVALCAQRQIRDLRPSFSLPRGRLVHFVKYGVVFAAFSVFVCNTVCVCSAWIKENLKVRRVIARQCNTRARIEPEIAGCRIEARRSFRRLQLARALQMLSRAALLRNQETEAALKLSKSYQTILGLRKLAALPIVTRRTCALFIPRSASSYWSMFDDPQFQPYTVAFVAPAVSGMSMIYGVPSCPIALKELYGFRLYDFEQLKDLETGWDLRKILARAKEKGFRSIYLWNSERAEAELIPIPD